MKNIEGRKAAGAERSSIPAMTSVLLLSGIAMALAACGSEPAADKKAGASVAAQAGTDGAATSAKAAGALLPADALAAWEGYAKGQCRDLEERFSAVRFAPIQSVDSRQDPAANSGAFFAAEFNGDGKPDFVVTTENWGCAGESDYGKMGPPYDFIVSTPKGYQAAYGFNGDIGPADIKRRGERDVIEYGRGWDGDCGHIKTITFAWTGTKMDAIEWRNDKGQPVDKEGCPVAAATKPAAASGKLPVQDGLWANSKNGGCAALKSPDGGPDFIIANNKMNFPQDYAELTPVQSLGGGRFQTGKDFDKMVIRVNSPKSLVVEEGPMTKGATYLWCSPATEWDAWYE